MRREALGGNAALLFFLRFVLAIIFEVNLTQGASFAFDTKMFPMRFHTAAEDTLEVVWVWVLELA